MLSTCGEQYGSIGVQLGARYDGSPIVAENGAPPADDFINYTPSSVPGGRAPHFWLDDGRGFGSSLFDRLGTGFTLLRLGGKAPDGSALAQAAARRGHSVRRCSIVPTAMRAISTTAIWRSFARISMSPGAAIKCRRSRTAVGTASSAAQAQTA